MTAPSQTPEAAGLEVVAWRSSWTGLTGRVVHALHEKKAEALLNAKWMENAVFEPLVTAASAQAAIDAERKQFGQWLVDAANARDAEKARADRLAKALEETRSRVREWPIGDHETCMCGSPVASHGMGDGHSPVSQGDHAISMIVDAIDAALQQETQP